MSEYSGNYYEAKVEIDRLKEINRELAEALKQLRRWSNSTLVNKYVVKQVDAAIEKSDLASAL